MTTSEPRRKSWPSVPLAFLLAAGCRATVPYERHELDGGVLLGARQQPGWENESVPLIRIDGALRPLSWPVGVRVSTSLSGYAGDQTGEQSIDLGLGLMRNFELMAGGLLASLGAGYLFVATDNAEIFAPESDSWQAPYVEGGLYVPLVPSEGFWLGLEARYSSGDGPELGATELDGQFLDLYLVARLGEKSRP